jgi:hypothetical protein
MGSHKEKWNGIPKNPKKNSTHLALPNEMKTWNSKIKWDEKKEQKWNPSIYMTSRSLNESSPTPYSLNPTNRT